MELGSRYLALEHQQRIAGNGNTVAVWGLILGAIAVLSTLFVSVHCYFAWPFGAQWVAIDGLRNNHGSPSLAQLWAPLQGQRQPMAKLAMWVDLLYFDGQNLSLILESYFLQGAHAFLLIWFLRRSSSWPAWLLAAGSGLALFSLFWMSQFQTFLTVSGVSVFSACLFGTLAVVALYFAICTPERERFWLVLTVASALLSELSLASGMLLWPLLIVMASRFHMRQMTLVVLAIVGCIAVFVYLPGYGEHWNFLAGFAQPTRFVEYLILYFGSLWEGLNLTIGRFLADASILAAGALYVRELTRKTPQLFSLVLLTLCIFLLGTGVCSALFNATGPITIASESRHHTPALLLWLFLMLYGIDMAQRHRMRSALLSSAFACMLATAMLPTFPPALGAADQLAAGIRSAGLPVSAGVMDSAAVEKFRTPAQLLFAQIDFLKMHHTAMFADPVASTPGDLLPRRFQIAPLDRCFGSFDTAARLDDARNPGWRLTGWAWDHNAARPVGMLVAVVNGGAIAGLGETGTPRPDVPPVFHDVTDVRIGWRLYLRGVEPFVKEVKVYGVVDNGRAVCLVTPAFSLPKKAP